MARVNVNILGIQARVLEWGAIAFSILGISELKWTGMGEFNSDDHCTYYCGNQRLAISLSWILILTYALSVLADCNLCPLAIRSCYRERNSFAKFCWSP